MRRLTDVKKDKPKPIDQPKPAPIPKPKGDGNMLAKAQLEATVAMTEVAANAMNNPQLTQLIDMLSQPKELKSNKRLTVNRDINGLIESIDIKEI